MLPTPKGYVSLEEAFDAVGHHIYGDDWTEDYVGTLQRLANPIRYKGARSGEDKEILALADKARAQKDDIFRRLQRQFLGTPPNFDDAVPVYLLTRTGQLELQPPQLWIEATKALQMLATGQTEAGLLLVAETCLPEAAAESSVPKSKAASAPRGAASFIYLHEAAEQLCEELDPDELALFRIYQFIREAWRGGLTQVYARSWDSPGNEIGGALSEVEPIDYYPDLDIHPFEGKNAREARIYRRPNGRDFPEAEWRELAITKEDLAKLREAILDPDASPTAEVVSEVKGRDGAPKRGGARKRGLYQSDLNQWLVLQPLPELKRIGAKAKAKQFWEHCHEEKTELVPLLPARWRSMVGSVERHIKNRPHQTPTRANVGQ